MYLSCRRLCGVVEIDFSISVPPPPVFNHQSAPCPQHKNARAGIFGDNRNFLLRTGIQRHSHRFLKCFAMVDVGSGDVGSGDVGSGDVGSGDVDSGDVGSGNLSSDVFSSARTPSPALSAQAYAADSPAYTIASSPIGAVSLKVDGGGSLAALPVPFVIRVNVGMHVQEDLPVTALIPAHGDATDGRYVVHLARPTRKAHSVGEALRHVNVMPVLDAQFVVHWNSEHLFDLQIQGPDVPSLHMTTPITTMATNVSSAGMAALSDGSGEVLRAASAAVFGWSAFNIEASSLTAAAVILRLSTLCSALSRGSRRDARDLGQRPLVGALLGDRGYFTNLTDESSGWVAKLDLGDAHHGDYRPVHEPLSTREARWFGIGAIERFADPLYARHTATSELGYVVPPAGVPPRVRTLAEATEPEECVMIEYEQQA